MKNAVRIQMACLTTVLFLAVQACSDAPSGPDGLDDVVLQAKGGNGGGGNGGGKGGGNDGGNGSSDLSVSVTFVGGIASGDAQGSTYVDGQSDVAAAIDADSNNRLRMSTLDEGTPDREMCIGSIVVEDPDGNLVEVGNGCFDAQMRTRQSTDLINDPDGAVEMWIGYLNGDHQVRIRWSTDCGFDGEGGLRSGGPLHTGDDAHFTRSGTGDPGDPYAWTLDSSGPAAVCVNWNVGTKKKNDDFAKETLGVAIPLSATVDEIQ